MWAFDDCHSCLTCAVNNAVHRRCCASVKWPGFVRLERSARVVGWTETHRFVQGDAKDWYWMIGSSLVFVYLSACLFKVYMHLYYAAGFRTIADIMAHHH